ncbi:hypothetical protein FHY55_07760 [Oceanicola sp. D3]|uniref:hypothetical protein n=1 Tax=Oceanicola sp. D3 TaxID=2587163 RepID=UPI00111F4FBA|nr:hypothetical protein [Oceanicola sp. D3]QDC09142.1 hypothetical protein FHY55_07760 [Oceanicola sp. D3]
MPRITMQWVTDCVSAIRDLKTMPESSSTLDVVMAVINARLKLDDLYQGSVYASYLKVSVGEANKFKAKLDDINEKYVRDLNQEMERADVMSLRGSASTLLSILSSELGVAPVFLLERKEGYDTDTLCSAGHQLFPTSIIVKVPDVWDDMQEAGKALAFDLPTACGFHVFRVLESTLRAYWDCVSDKKKRPKPATIGNFARALKEENLGEEKIWETLSQISRLHRNPIMHPEVLLTNEEAIETLGIARSAIGAMARVLPERPDLLAHFSSDTPSV